jgi:hypothetical protein
MKSSILETSPNNISITKQRRIRCGGQVAHKEMINSYKMLVGKFEAKRPLRRPRCRWEDNIKMNLTQIRYEEGAG